jgi:hypothetical protein
MQAGRACSVRPHAAWPGLLSGYARVAGRLASRGRAGSAASDFGALEVFAGASIAHTDPFAVCRALDEQLAALGAAGAPGATDTLDAW